MEESNKFEIVIDFSKGGNPNRVFRSIADLIDSFQDLDSTLAEVVGVKVDNTLVLEDIKNGSLKTIIRNLVNDVPDEDLRDANFKRILGVYLVKGKYAVLRWCQENPKLTGPEQVTVLENKLLEIAEETSINRLAAYRTPSKIKLLTNISSIQKSTRYLTEEDTVHYYCNDGSSQITDSIEISDSIVENILTKEILDDRSEAILKVKKADYLGISKWVFKFEGHSIDVSITHVDWLEKFQHKQVIVLPGDSIRGTLVRYISYSYDNEVLSIRYELEHVKEVIQAKKYFQPNLEIFNLKE